MVATNFSNNIYITHSFPLINLVGVPATTTLLGIFLITTDPEPIILFEPSFNWPFTTVQLPTKVSSPTETSPLSTTLVEILLQQPISLPCSIKLLVFITTASCILVSRLSIHILPIKIPSPSIIFGDRIAVLSIMLIKRRLCFLMMFK
ncbi:hypothetical protein HmCmsJML015_00550 [Escherichia coli]|nr:hypothetical protein HmCmsJML015_00550 [Escherichia coli]GCX36185.1 hypothetical protein HmCmsJML111_01912 [Escherichia coli]GCX57551.1 hypothetical protein HmCmsJML120_01283 [Escherichia coli]GCZ68619.1 hypothetical protein HmCmsJML162_02491 [Escherichia coli]